MRPFTEPRVDQEASGSPISRTKSTTGLAAHALSAIGPHQLTLERFRGFTNERVAAEAEVLASGIGLPVSSRADWQRAHGATDSILVVARESGGPPIHAVSASIGLSRALPGHRIYRVERFGGRATHFADEVTLYALVEMAHSDMRCLRLVIELFEADCATRSRLAGLLARLGLRREPVTRMYERTLGIELRRSTVSLLAALHKTGRRNIRSPEKRGLEVGVISDVALAPRLGELMRQTFDRTASTEVPRPWREIIAISSANPTLSRLTGLFDPHVDGPDGLLAFAWGCCHGEYVTYEEGASLRRPDLATTSLSYAPLWDLITWANEQTKASWFDLGGIGANDESDPHRGITEFKRYFSRDTMDVGEQWMLEPLKLQAAVARGVRTAARWMDVLWRSARSQDAANDAAQSQTSNGRRIAPKNVIA